MEKTGIHDVRIGKQESEKSLFGIFRKAAENNKNLRLLRLAGPREFRENVIRCETKHEKAPEFLIDKRIQKLEFILTNPYSESFLSRMDAEHKGNCSIWRVKDQVILFAKGLININKERDEANPILLAFHSTDLIWNLGIVGNNYVVARAYHETSTGHDDEIAELHMITGQKSRLGESLISYYESIKNNERTRFVKSAEDIDSLGNWPSLFKGNALIRQPYTNLPNTLEKRCGSAFCSTAEKIWLKSWNEVLPCKYFHPIEFKKECKRNKPFIGKNICIPFIEGVTATELLGYLQRGKIDDPKFRRKLETLASSVVYQSFKALEEFREIGKLEIIKKKLRPYPWKKKLDSAFMEAGRFIPVDTHLKEECRKDLNNLGTNLERIIRASPQLSAPFRDAHLKNRLIKIKNISENGNNNIAFNEWLRQIEAENIFLYLVDNTVDIDFETALYSVTPHDDPLHILLAQDFGLNQVENFNSLKEWWPSFDSDDNTLWMTLLARSFREYCRRLWYNHIMPWTFNKRYHLEAQNHFLNLSRMAVYELNGYSDIMNLLNECHDLNNSMWKSIEKTENNEPIIIKKNPQFDKIDSNIRINEKIQDDFGLRGKSHRQREPNQTNIFGDVGTVLSGKFSGDVNVGRDREGTSHGRKGNI